MPEPALKLAAAAVLAFASSLSTASPANAVITSIGGDVTCINWLQQNSKPVGVWVDTNTKDGWASLNPAQNPARGMWATRIWFSAPDAYTFRLNIGCGGTPQRWGTTVRKTIGPSIWSNLLEARYW